MLNQPKPQTPPPIPSSNISFLLEKYVGMYSLPTPFIRTFRFPWSLNEDSYQTFFFKKKTVQKNQFVLKNGCTPVLVDNITKRVLCSKLFYCFSKPSSNAPKKGIIFLLFFDKLLEKCSCLGCVATVVQSPLFFFIFCNPQKRMTTVLQCRQTSK